MLKKRPAPTVKQLFRKGGQVSKDKPEICPMPRRRLPGQEAVAEIYPLDVAEVARREGDLAALKASLREKRCQHQEAPCAQGVTSIDRVIA